MPKVLFGFKISSGDPLYITPQHLASLGMTQLSGKTTANEALINRSGARGIAFITKRGESGFQHYNLTKPYFKSGRGWQYVESLCDVALGEKVKYEPRMRFAIMQVSRDMKDLQDVRNNAVKLLETAKKAWDKEVFSKLIAYLDLVLPELGKVDFADKVVLNQGINVMDLVGMKLQTQQLIISSTLQYVYEKMNNVIAIIPEAWEHLPQSRKTPVKFVAEQYIRKGASVKNFLWLDTQDIGGIDKTPLRQVSTWIIGRMMEAHEVERLLKQLLGLKIAPKEIQTLPLGHFYVVHGTKVTKAYALPAGVPTEVGRKVAMGELTPEYVRDHFLKPSTFGGNINLEITVQKLEQKNKVLEERLKTNVDLYGKLAEEHEKLKGDHEKQSEEIVGLVEQLREFKGMEGIRAFFIDMIHTEVEGLLRNRVEPSKLNGPNEVNVTQERTKLNITKPLKVLNVDSTNLQGRLALLYADNLLPNGWFRPKDVRKLMEARGWNWDPRTGPKLTEMCQWGFLTTRRVGHKAREYKVLMTPKEATEKGLLTVKEVKM